MAADSGDVSVLAILDLSAAFDTANLIIIIQRLHNSHHVKGTALCWFDSYFNKRYQAVMYVGITAPAAMAAYGVPQISVLGPSPFIIYTANILCIVNGRQLMFLCYADDTQVYFYMKIDKIPFVKALLKTALASSAVGLQSIRCDSNRTRWK